jgi:hypothetical protein
VEIAVQKIRRAIYILGMLCGFVIGLTFLPDGVAFAQRPVSDGQQKARPPVWNTPVPAPAIVQGDRTLWPHQPKVATHWTLAEIKAAHEKLAQADKAGTKIEPNSALHDFPYWTRTHAMFVEHVSPKDQASRTSARQHLGYAQFVVVMGGEGTAVAGGQLENPTVLQEKGEAISGELRGASIRNGQTFNLHEGDVLSVPGNTPLQLRTSALGGMTYMTVKINAMMYPWELIR